jgi:hypothetical protein
MINLAVLKRRSSGVLDRRIIGAILADEHLAIQFCFEREIGRTSIVSR